MKKIKFTIDSNTLKINYKIENNTIKNIVNTNILTQDDLIFDLKYFNDNKKTIAGFLNVMVKNDNVKNAIIEDEDLIIPGLEFLNYLPNIKNLVIVPDIPINYEMHLAILKNDTLEKINCYTIPTYLLERIDTTKSVKIETRNEVFFISNFIRVNGLNTYADVFYKRKLVVTYEFSETDWEDFISFLVINVHLKSIYFDYVSISLIKKFIKVLADNNRTNIRFDIKGAKNNLSHFREIESLVKKNKIIKKNNYKFRIDYTEEYKLENFFKLINFTTVKYIFITIILAAIFGYGLNTYDIYQSSKQVEEINDSINKLLEEFEYYEPEPTTTTTTKKVNGTTPTTKKTTTKSNYVSPYYKNYSKVISVLKNTNSDTVGWLTVNNTGVNYPVVQTTNNSFYLTHDFNKKSNSLGWVFMDYRNDPVDLNQNTIIYAHNVYNTNIMFASLEKTLKPNWYNNSKNHIISFSTANSEEEWQIFSIYRLEATNDYLYSKFDTQDDFLKFANKMKDRSIHDFGVTLKENDKILTLSTCINRGKDRIVVHAVLLK